MNFTGTLSTLATSATGSEPPAFTGSTARARRRSDQQREVQRPSCGWLVFVWGAFLAAAVVSLGFVSAEHLASASMALANVFVTGLICIRILRVNPVSGLVPCLFLVPTVILGSISTLYFSALSPDSFATFGLNKTWFFVQSNAFYQGTVMVCVVTLALPWLLFQPADRSLAKYASFRRAAVNATMPTFLVFVGSISALLALRLLSIESSTPVGYIVYGVFRYTTALPLVAGAAWADLPKRTRLFILGVLTLNVLLNTATNSRYYAFIPPAFFASGVMFFSGVSIRRKYLTLVTVVCVVAGVLVIGNAARRLGLGLWYGGIEDLQHRIEVLTQKSDQLTNVRWGDEIFGRLFFLGGHQIVTLMPSVAGFKQFDLSIYIAEVASQGLLPRHFANYLVRPYHEEKSSLVALGHRLSERHSVERSFIGAAWELGGYGPLITISFVTGSFLLLLTVVIEQQLLPRVPRLAVVCYAIFFDGVLKSISEGLPSLAHECIYGVVIGTGLYAVVWLLGNTIARRSFLALPRLKSIAPRMRIGA